MSFDIRKTFNAVRTDIQNRVEKGVEGGKQLIADHKSALSGGIAAAANSSKAIKFGVDAFQQARNVANGAGAIGVLGEANRAFLSNPVYNQGFKGLTAFGAKASAALRYAGIPGTLMSGATAVKDIRDAIRTGSKEDIIDAARSSLDTAKAGLTTATGGILGSKVMGGVLGGTVIRNKLAAGAKAAEAFKTALPKASDAVLKAVRDSATKGVFEGLSPGNLGKAVTSAASDAARAGGTLAGEIVGSGKRAGARAAAKVVGREAGEVALKQAAKAAAGPAAKALGRFAPGVNVAIAAVDVANAGATLMDKDASIGKKATSVVTAVGSVVAATNIPIVSQVGAAVSTVSSIVGAFFGG